MQDSTRRPPLAPMESSGGSGGKRHGHLRETASPAPAAATCAVSEQFTLSRLLEKGQAVEVIPGVLYFASLAERPPPARDFAPPISSQQSSRASSEHEPPHLASTLDRPAPVDPLTSAAAAETTAAVTGLGGRPTEVPPARAGSKNSSRTVSLPQVLQPLQMPGRYSVVGGDASTAGPSGGIAGFSTSSSRMGTAPTPNRPHSGTRRPSRVPTASATATDGPAPSTDRRESVLSMTDLPPSAVSVTTGTAASPTTQARSGDAVGFSLKEYLKGRHPGVSYPVRASSAGPRGDHASTSVSGGTLGGSGGGGLLKASLTRPHVRAASAGTHHGLVVGGGSVTGAGGSTARRRAERSVSISVVPVKADESKEKSAVHAMVDSTTDKPPEDSAKGSGVHFPPVAAHLHEALQLPGDSGNGGACLLSPHDGAFYVSIFGDPAFEYRSFFADFGPLDLGCVVRFSRRLARLLEMSAGFEWHDTDKIVSEMTMGSAAAAAAAAARKSRTLSVLEPPTDLAARLEDVVPIVVCTGLETHERSNVACLLGCFCVGALRWSASVVQQRLPQRVYPPLLAFRDASSGASSYPLSVTDVVRGMRKASQLAWVDIRSFDVEAYDRAKLYDYTWIVPNKMLAMSSPEDDKPSRTGQVYARLLGDLGVTMVVRLNDPLYDAGTFWKSGIHHVELEFPDGTAPNDADLKRFLSAVEEAFGESTGDTACRPCATVPTAASAVRGAEVGGTYRGLPSARTHVPTAPGKRASSAAPRARPPSGVRAPATVTGKAKKKKGIVAVHCRAGLGRTGTVIAVYMMRHYGFTARESISWIRLCRPGSITGIQQQYLETIERRLTPPARVWTDLQWAASAAGSVGYGGGRMDASQPAYQSHGAVAMDPSRHGAATNNSGRGSGGDDGDGGSGRPEAGSVDVFAASMISDAPPPFAVSPPHTANGRRTTMTIFHSGVSRSLALGGDPGSAPTPLSGGGVGGGEGPDGSLSGLFFRRGTPVSYSPEHNGGLAGGGNALTVGGAAGSRPGTASGMGGNNAATDAAEQRYELAEVEALLCDPAFVPHRSILERLKYPSSYFLALEQANPFGTAVALQREFASRRRQQPALTRAAVEKVSHTPVKSAGVAAGRAASAGAAAAAAQVKAAEGSSTYTQTGGRGVASDAKTVAVRARSSPARPPSLCLDASAVAQAAVARSNAALTSRGGIAARYQAIRSRDVHAMLDTAPLAVPSRIRLNSTQLDGSSAAVIAGGISLGHGSGYGTATGATAVAAMAGAAGATTGTSGVSALAYRENFHAPRRTSVNVGDTGLSCPTPSAAGTAGAGGTPAGAALLDCSVLLSASAPLQAVNPSARSLSTVSQVPPTAVIAPPPAGATTSLGSNHSSGQPPPGLGGVSSPSSMVTPHRPPLAPPKHHVTDSTSGASLASLGVAASPSHTVYANAHRTASVAALQPALITAATAAGISSSSLFLPSVSAGTVGGGGGSVTAAQRKAAMLGWGARELRVAR